MAKKNVELISLDGRGRLMTTADKAPELLASGSWKPAPPGTKPEEKPSFTPKPKGKEPEFGEDKED